MGHGLGHGGQDPGLAGLVEATGLVGHIRLSVAGIAMIALQVSSMRASSNGVTSHLSLFIDHHEASYYRPSQ